MMDKILGIAENEKLVAFLDKFKGAYFGILAGITQIILLTVGTAVFNLTEPTPITFGSHWVSSIGGAKGGSQYIFIVCMILTLIFCVPFIIDLIRHMLPGNEKQRWMFLFPLLFSLTTITGGVGLTIFNMTDFDTIHVVFATLFFISVALMVALLSFIMLFNTDMPKFQAFVGLGAGAVFLAFLVPFIPYLLSGVNFVTLITSLDPEFMYFRITEWLAIIALLIWFIETSVYLIIW